MNVAEKLASEISRVTTLRCVYVALRGTPQVNVEPAIALMSLALIRAIKAAGVNDAFTQMEAVEELEGFTE